MISGWALRLLFLEGWIILSRSILCSLPLYVLWIMRLLRPFRRNWKVFLLDSFGILRFSLIACTGGSKMIFATIENCVLEFKMTWDIVDTFSLKFWWLFQSQRSLWKMISLTILAWTLIAYYRSVHLLWPSRLGTYKMIIFLIVSCGRTRDGSFSTKFACNLLLGKNWHA